MSKSLLATTAILISMAAPAAADECGSSANFNSCILAAVDLIHSTREKLGYGDSAFTRDLDYGPQKAAIKKGHLSPKTMCVAAVSEVWIEALNLYYKKSGDTTPFSELSAARWNGWTASDIRPYMWEDPALGSHSAGNAFSKFGIGEQRDFTDLEPGDFVSFDRAHGGHSVIFLGYLDKDYKLLPKYSNDVAGFKFFSSQETTNGFAYKWAFFSGSDGKGVCSTPNSHPEMPRDCAYGGVQRHSVVGRGGRAWAPSKWHVKPSTDQLIASLKSIIRPVVEQQFEQQIGGLASVLSSGQVQKPANQLSLPGVLSSIAKQPAFQSKEKIDQLSQSTDARKELLQTPEIQALIEQAVQNEIEKPRLNAIDPKLLVSDKEQ